MKTAQKIELVLNIESINFPMVKKFPCICLEYALIESPSGVLEVHKTIGAVNLN